MFQNGETPLHAAALFGHMKVTRLLMQYGADKTLKNKVMQQVFEFLNRFSLSCLVNIKLFGL